MGVLVDSRLTGPPLRYAAETPHKPNRLTPSPNP